MKLARAVAGLALVVNLFNPFNQINSELPKGYVAYRTTSSIWIDGKLDDGPWKSAQWSGAFVDIEGSARPQPRHATRVKMLWDQIYFYIGADLTEPHLWATLEEHDSVVFRDNDFEVFIDPNGDNHEYYELEINALGTTWDLLLPKPYKDDGKAVNDWEIAGMKSAVHLDGTLNDPRDSDRGWTVELALPWKALGELARRPSPPQDGDQWRVNFSRVQWQLTSAAGKYEKVPKTNEHNWVWSPQGVVDMHRPEKWGYVQFSSAPGATAFVPDPAWSIREGLHAIYYAQRDFRRKQGRWAGTFAELGGQALQNGLFEPRLEVAGDQFEVSAKPSANAQERWHIRQDSLIWKK
ncbi:MAG TPA: carbohydrate-binding family 9-like protein [Vicinamibacterales bacterium]|nr:carbohydrate-binding family 9-like protein [Vicinamibacterales bacterium]